MEFAEKLTALRKGRDLTQEKLAEQLNVLKAVCLKMGKRTGCA